MKFKIKKVWEQKTQQSKFGEGSTYTIQGIDCECAEGVARLNVSSQPDLKFLEGREVEIKSYKEKESYTNKRGENVLCFDVNNKSIITTLDNQRQQPPPPPPQAPRSEDFNRQPNTQPQKPQQTQPRASKSEIDQIVENYIELSSKLNISEESLVKIVLSLFISKNKV